jgi:hypothetical protein
MANIWGLTNRQLMVVMLRRMVEEVEAGLVSQRTLDEAKAALSEVVRAKRPTATLKESKRIPQP